MSTGWTTYGGSNVTITRGTGYHPDPDYEARVYQTTGGGSGLLYQTHDIPTLNLNFSVQTKLYAYDNHASAWAAAAIVLYYYKTSTQILGRTMWAYMSPGCPWQNSSTLHIYKVTNQNWNHYEINVEEEINNYLPGVNPSEVTKIRVALYTTAYHC